SQEPLQRAVCFRCYFHVGIPELIARGAGCPRCNFPLILTLGRLRVTQEEVERIFDRLRDAQSRGFIEPESVPVTPPPQPAQTRPPVRLVPPERGVAAPSSRSSRPPAWERPAGMSRRAAGASAPPSQP